MSEDMQQTCKHLGGAVHTAALGKTAMLMESTTTIMLKKAPDSRQRTKRKGGNVLISLMTHASTVNPKVFKALINHPSHKVAKDAYTATIGQNRGVTFTTEQVQRMARFVQHFVATDNDTANQRNPDAAGPVDLTVFIHMAHDAQIPKQEAADADDDEDYSDLDLDLDDEDDEDYSDLDIPTATAEVPVTTPDGLTSLDDAKAHVIAAGGPVAVLTAFNARLEAAQTVLQGTAQGIRSKAFNQTRKNGEAYTIAPVGSVTSLGRGSLIQRVKGAAFNMVGIAPKRGPRGNVVWPSDNVLTATNRAEREKQVTSLVVIMAAVVEMHDHDVTNGDPRQYIDDSWLDHPYLDLDVVGSPVGQAKSWRIPPYARGDGSSGDKVDLATMDVSDLLGF